jgi:hypothetical protein
MANQETKIVLKVGGYLREQGRLAPSALIPKHIKSGMISALAALPPRPSGGARYPDELAALTQAVKIRDLRPLCHSIEKHADGEGVTIE